MAVLVNDTDALVNDDRYLVNGGTATPDPTTIPLPYGSTAQRAIPTYELGLWQRTPQSGAAATFVEVGRIVSPTITWSDELDGDGRLNASCVPDRLDDDVRTAIRDAADPTSPQGCELRLLRDGTVVWAGPLVGGQIQGGTLTLVAFGLSAYLRGMFVTSDLTYSATDQYTIGKGLVDHWQALTYGNYGIDTSGIGTSGTTRDRTYKAAEHPNIHRELSNLAAVDGGFNWHVDAATRALTFAASRGTDLSASVVLDSRNVGDAGIAFDTTPGQFGTVALGVGTSGTDAPITSTQTNATALASFGRWGVAGTFDGVTVQGTLDSHTQRMVDDYSVPTFAPGPDLIPIEEADVGDFGPGDTVQWAFDAGLGLQTFDRRIATVQFTVGPDGGETMAVGFL